MRKRPETYKAVTYKVVRSLSYKHTLLIGTLRSNITVKIKSVKEEKGEQKERDWDSYPTLPHLHI